MAFWGELRRRNVFKVGAAYLLVAWIVAQIVNVIHEPLRLPEWFDTAVLVFLGAGFPVALIFAWAYELTPEGLKRTHEVPVTESIAASTGQKLNYVLGGLVAGAVIGTGGFWAMSRDGGSEWARSEAIPQIERYVEIGDFEAAHALAKEVERRAPGNDRLAALWPSFAQQLSIPSEPPGARVFRRAYDSTGDDWEEIGVTPIASVRLPYGLSRLRFELEGHRPLLRTHLGPLPVLTGERRREEVLDASFSLYTLQPTPFKLDTSESLPEGKVRVPGWQENVDGETLQFGDFLLGRHEVTANTSRSSMPADTRRRATGATRSCAMARRFPGARPWRSSPTARGGPGRAHGRAGTTRAAKTTTPSAA